MTRLDWYTRQNTKRDLSRSEKATIPSRDGLAVFFPGPPVNGRCLEYDELLEVGFTRSQIIGIEHDPDVYDRLALETDIDVRFGEAADVIAALDGPIVYAHLDHCGWLMEEEVEAIRALRGRLADVCRIRTTLFRMRKPRDGDQVRYEQALAGMLAHELIKYAGLDEEVASRLQYDAPHAGAALAALSSLCPPHCITRLRYDIYSDMTTIWWDLEREASLAEVWSSLTDAVTYLAGVAREHD